MSLEEPTTPPLPAADTIIDATAIVAPAADGTTSEQAANDTGGEATAPGTALAVVEPKKGTAKEFATTEKHERDFSIEIHRVFRVVAEICATAILTRDEKKSLGKDDGQLTLADGVHCADQFLHRFIGLMDFRKLQGPSVLSTKAEDFLYTPVVHIMQKTCRVLMEHDLPFLAVAFMEKVLFEGRFNKRKDFMDVAARAWERAVMTLPSADQVSAAKRILEHKKLEQAASVITAAAMRIDYQNQPCMTSEEFSKADFSSEIIAQMDKLRNQYPLPIELPLAYKKA